MELTGAFGDQLGRYFGLSGAPSLTTAPGRRPRFAVTRICCGIDQLGLKQEIPPEDVFVLTLYLADLNHLEVWQRGRPIEAGACARGSISIVNLVDALSVYIGGPLDCLSFYIPREMMDRLTDGAGESRIGKLHCPLGRADPTIEQIGLALLPLLKSPASMAPAFLDHIALATSAHLAQAYGNFQPERKPVSLDRFTRPGTTH